MTGRDFLELTPANLGSEHLCCALSGKLAEGVEKKKAFLARGFRRGLVFRKPDVRGKVFVEYAPAEAAWRPLEAPGYLVIHCLWISGRYKERGLGRDLLHGCLDDVGKRNGVVAVSGRTSWVTNTDFCLHHGFDVVETTATGFDLVCRRSKRTAPLPRFTGKARNGVVSQQDGVHFEYVHQCPFVPSCLRNMSSAARDLGLTVTTRELATPRAARHAASPFGTFGVFLYGRFLTHKTMTAGMFRSLLLKTLEDEGRTRDHPQLACGGRRGKTVRE